MHAQTAVIVLFFPSPSSFVSVLLIHIWSILYIVCFLFKISFILFLFFIRWISPQPPHRYKFPFD